MNARAKGARIEREFEKNLQAAGYVTQKAVCSKFNRNDIFGCFDVMAKHKKSPDKTFYFQISTQWKGPVARAEIERFPRGIYDMVFLVRKKDRKDFEYRHLTDDGWIDVEDF